MGKTGMLLGFSCCKRQRKKKIAKDGCVMQSSYFVTTGAGGNMAHSGFD